MKKLLIILCAITIIFSYNSCKKSNDTPTYVGNWTKKSDLDGVARSGAVSFCIGNVGYMGLGYDGRKWLKDFWKYDSDKDSWTRIDSFPGIGRTSAVGFSVNGKGYVGTGYDGENSNYLKDFYEYDPATNKWDSIAIFEGGERYGAVSFSLGNKGYVGTGYNGNYLKDFWSYDPASGKWDQITSINGSKRRNAVSFVIGGYGYVCTGVDNGQFVYDFWRYNASTDTWEGLRNISNTSSDSYDDAYAIVRANGVGFSSSDKGYVALGTNGSILNNVWEYDPSTDLWTQKTGFEGTARTSAVAFSLNNRLFITTGQNSTYSFDDLWEFKPNDVYDANN